MEMVNCPAGWYEAPFVENCSCDGIEGCCGQCVWPKVCAHVEDKFKHIEDTHYPECPMSIAAAQKRLSTCCLCANIERAEKDAQIEIDDRYEEKGY
jgi:hypothetical protein